MSEGDLLQGSPEEDEADRSTEIRTENRDSESSPPRSRSQSAGHREALLFFERHQLLQNHDLLSLEPWNLYDNSTEISSLSKSPSPAHFSDIQSSFTDEGQFLLKSGDKKRASGILKVRSANNLTVHSCNPEKSSGTRTPLVADERDSKPSPSRNRSIRGRSHSQPSQVILSSTGEQGGSGFNRRKRDSGRNWLEQIQFTAQYKHYRTNDYASVVNSATSLDKAGINQGRRTISTAPIGGTPPRTDSSNPNPSDLTGNRSKRSRWNFPGEKLRRLFNAKSLDDILGRNKTLVSPGHTEPCNCCEDEELSSGGITEGITGGATTTSGYFSDVTPTKSRNSSLTSLKIYNPFVLTAKAVEFSSSTETVGDGSNTIGPLQQLAYTDPLANTGSFGGGAITSSEKPLQTTSPSRSTANKSSRKSPSHLTSTLASVLLRVPQFQFNPTGTSKDKKRWTNLKKGKPSKSQSSGSLNRVTCPNAKYNNYLNRIVASATCARFTVANSVDNLITTTANTNTNPNTSSSGTETTANNSSNSCTSCTTVVEPFSSSSKAASGSGPPPAKQRNWTAVKHKWDLKLQSSSTTTASNPPNILFVKSNLSQISGVDIDSDSASGAKEACQLESLTSTAYPSPKTSKSFEYGPVQPHEPGRVSFRLEPEEIPSSSPTISRSQSSDCRPQQIDPNLIFSTPSEEESEEMTKSRHFHYREPRNPSRQQNQNYQDQSPDANKANMTSKEKAQLVVVNLTYLQRPTSPCILNPGDPSYSSSSSSPIVFTDNHNYSTNPQIHPQSITSPGTRAQASSLLTKPESSSAYNARMKEEYLSSSHVVGGGRGGAKNINLFSSKEPVLENINKSVQERGGGSFVAPNNDVVSATRGLTSGANDKPSLFGCVGSRLRDPCHDDMTISSSKDSNLYNKNVSGLGATSEMRIKRNRDGQTTSGGGGSQPIDRDLSSYGYHNQSSQDNQILPDTSTIPGNQEREESLRKFSDSKSVDSEVDEMADLQSPTYVKRTANMFNSRYSSPQHNGSTTSASSDHIKENRNPSYLNVSRSVSGYSCLSYSNGNGVANGSSTTNGTSPAKITSPYSQKFISPSTKVRSEFTVKSIHPQIESNFDREYVVDDDDHRNIKSPNKYQSSPCKIEETIEESSYVPSHGKSFIMQRIERLYGSDAVSSAGVFSRKSSDSKGVSTTTTIRFESSLKSSNGSGKERVIPIQIEDSIVAKERQQDHRNLPFERHIRGDEILISDSDSNEPTSPKSSTSLKMITTQHNTSISRGVYDGIPLESSPGNHRLHTISLDEDERRQLLNQRNGDRSSNEYKPKPSSVFEKHANSNYTNGSHNTSKNDSGIIDDKELDNMGPSSSEECDDDLNTSTNANDSNDPMLVGASRADNTSSLKSPSSGAEATRPVALVKTKLTADDSGILDSEEYSSNDKHITALYSHRKSSLSSNSSSSSGSPEPGGSPSKPKIKPKPKDMALLRTLSHSPQPKSLLTERSGFCSIASSESQDKTGIYSNIGLDKIIGAGGQRPNQMGEDWVDSDSSNKTLSDIKNIVKISSKGESPEESEDFHKTHVVSTDVAEPSLTLVQDKHMDKENDVKPVSDPPSVVKDGNYFLIQMNNAKTELQRRADKASVDLEKLDPQSEAAGNTLAAIGKANLLTKKKFKQFEELCNANMKGVTGDQPATTNEDLDGFWDMVMIQVDLVYDSFRELDGEPVVKSIDSTDAAKTRVPLSTRKAVSSSTSTKVIKPAASKSQTSAAAKARDESRRKLLAEKRRLMKDQAQSTAPTAAQEDILIFTPDQTDD